MSNLREQRCAVVRERLEALGNKRALEVVDEIVLVFGTSPVDLTVDLMWALLEIKHLRRLFEELKEFDSEVIDDLKRELKSD